MPVVFLSRLKALGCVAAASAALLTPAAAAEPACRGKDMLAELERTEPATHARIAAAAAATRNTEALLWRIEKAGLAPSHLIGTVHLSDERVGELSPKVREAIAGAKAMAFEVADLSAAAMGKAVGQTAGLFVYADGRRLDTVLAPDEFAKAKASLAKAGLPAEAAAQIKPWLVFMLLSMSECERRRTSTGELVFDMRLADEGRKRKLPVVGLETLESQLRMLAEIPDAQQIFMLKAVLHYADRTDDQMETMLQLYLGRRMGYAIPFQHHLAAKAGIEPAAYSSFESEIIVRRNVNMATAAKPLLDQGAAFIGVGALHLVGEHGLVELIRKAGFTVTPVE